MNLARSGTLRMSGEKTQDGLDELVVVGTDMVLFIPDEGLARPSRLTAALCLGRGGTLGLDAL